MLPILLAFLARLLLILLFFPFSALDKALNFSLATKQAAAEVPNRSFAQVLVVGGLAVEVVMSLGVLTGVFDKVAALVLALYCIVTAVLWKPFWRGADFRLVGASKSREVFWDFLKNLAVAGGFLMLAFGGSASSARAFLNAPFASHSPYSSAGSQ